ncbi:MAG TPA: FkbM family methyltransferase [Chitinophagaceae bacterium]|jgi:FkbM family methyltransferase|nr:FkbM family methyltransferase [Chitinophagaceae bacterium]
MIFLNNSMHARIVNRLKLMSVVRLGYKSRVLNTTFKIPVIENNEGLIYHLGVGEPYLLEVFSDLYKSRKYVFLDAGVNFGQTLLKIKAVAPDAPYIGFEPSGLCSYYTSLLIKTNALTNAKLIRCALSNKPGVLTLFAQAEGDTRATVLANSFATGKDLFQELVPAVTLDSLVPVVTASGKDIILKVDVEGAEWMVFQGAESFITEYKPVIVFENLPYQDDVDKQQRQQFISAFLGTKGYNIYLIDEEKKKLQAITAINNKQDFLRTNYLAITGEQSSQFKLLP